MSRSKTSKAWMREHVNDPYVQKAKAEGYRSRAAYKLLELDKKDRLLAPGRLVVDLGAAPGSWSQVAAAKLGARGRVVAVDIAADGAAAGRSLHPGRFPRAGGAGCAAARLGSEQGRPCNLRPRPQYLRHSGKRPGASHASGRIGAGICPAMPEAGRLAGWSRCSRAPVSPSFWERCARLLPQWGRANPKPRAGARARCTCWGRG